MTVTRRFIQGLLLVIFLFLFVRTESTGDNELGYPVRLFLDFDPLILVATLLSTHTLKEGFYFALLLLGLTLLLGRFFCGWICPLGTLNDAAGAANLRREDKPLSYWPSVKYLILAFVLASALLGFQAAGILDPLSLLVRSLTTGVQPAFEYGVRAFFDTAYRFDIPLVTPMMEALYGVTRSRLLSFHQPYFMQGFLISAILALVLLLNLVRRRFWCRYLCPLGALLGLLSRWSLVRRSVSEGCVSCGGCRRVCRTGAIPGEQGTALSGECIACLDCRQTCAEKAVVFGFGRSASALPLDTGRRSVLASLAGGLMVPPFLRVTPLWKPSSPPGDLIRPPGALPERGFLAACIRCGQCMKVCITNGLKPTLMQAGLEGVWSPLLVPRIGPCEFRCTLCGQVCPTGAIRRIGPEEKETVKIGMAVIDRGRCLPWANGLPCVVCEEVCPTPEKAIYMNEVSWADRRGTETTLQVPLVDLERCVGCGACEYHCPVAGKPAVYVISTGESRNPDNRALL